MPQSRREEYREKLRDPRWQKKRLEIFERDGWECQICKDTTNTLNVHHLGYFDNTDPWDYEQFFFMTLCESCHEAETQAKQAVKDMISMILNSSPWLSKDLAALIKPLCLFVFATRDGKGRSELIEKIDTIFPKWLLQEWDEENPETSQFNKKFYQWKL